MLQWGQNRVESLWATEQDQQATGTAESTTFNIVSTLLAKDRYDEKDEPQPQDREELGLIKLKPCRISVSS